VQQIVDELPRTAPCHACRNRIEALMTLMSLPCARSEIAGDCPKRSSPALTPHCGLRRVVFSDGLGDASGSSRSLTSRRAPRRVRAGVVMSAVRHESTKAPWHLNFLREEPMRAVRARIEDSYGGSPNSAAYYCLKLRRGWRNLTRAVRTSLNHGSC
jgi:hypothetical protein